MIPATGTERIKILEKIIVPLFGQAVEILRRLESLTIRGIPARLDEPPDRLAERALVRGCWLGVTTATISGC